MTPQGFVPDPSPYLLGAPSGGRETVLNIFLWEGLPYGTYTFYAAAFKHGEFFEKAADPARVTFVFTSEREPKPLIFSTTSFPDGVIGQRYLFMLEPQNGSPPFQVEILEGELPPGLELNPQTVAIEGEPTERGVWHVKIQVMDSMGNRGICEGDIRVFGVLTVGPHGTYQGCNGLQMAINAAQDLDEIRIEQGTYECTGLAITSKNFEHGIKISGGWDETFRHQADNASLTVLKGDAEPLSEVNSREACNAVSGWWLGQKCFARKPSGTRIITVNNGPVTFENLSFENGFSSQGGGVQANAYVEFRNSIFINNAASYYGGAVKGDASFINCTFTNNIAVYYGGGAVDGRGTFTNCTFTNNTAANGGAVNGKGTFIGCTFINNSAGSGGATNGWGNFINCLFKDNFAKNGGAVWGDGIFTNCKFSNNSAVYGGAVNGRGTFTNCIFINNTAEIDGGAVNGEGTFVNCIFVNNTGKNGGAIIGQATLVNSLFYGNKAENTGGAAYISGTILNSIFYQNTAGGSFQDFTPSGELVVDYSLFNYPSGAYDHGPHNLMGDPRFVNPTNSDFHLRSNSPAIDKGDSSIINLCQEYYHWGEEGCDETCRETCEDLWSNECRVQCCKCKKYTYPFPRDKEGHALDLDGRLRIYGESVDLGPYEYH